MSETNNVENKKEVEALEIEMKANAVNEELGHNEIRLKDDESVSLAVIRGGDDVKGFFKRGANYLFTITEIPEETSPAAPETPVQQQQQPEQQPPQELEQLQEQSNVESHNTTQSDSGAVEAGASGSGEEE